jgi:hypothetical protein
MLQQLLWIEIALKGAGGLILLIAPGYAATIFGLPATGAGFWPRVVGALLLGIAAALFLQGEYPAFQALKPAGLIAVNLTGAAILCLLLVLKRASTVRRGNVLLWGITVTLIVLSLFELSFA